jgi:hypothetical protein
MATRTAPDVSLAPSYYDLTLYFIDYTGDKNTLTIRLASLIDHVELEALVTAIQAATNASVYRVDQTNTWRGSMDSSNATNLPRSSVNDGVNLLFRKPDFSSQTVRVVAPIDALMISNTDIPNPASAQLAAVITALLASSFALGELESYSYSERRETNTRYRV